MPAELPELEELRGVALDPAAPLDRRQGAARLWLDVARAAGLDLSWSTGRGGEAAAMTGVLLELADDPAPAAPAAPEAPEAADPAP